MVNLAPRAIVGSPYSLSSSANVTPGGDADAGALAAPSAPWLPLMSELARVTRGGGRVFASGSRDACEPMFADFRDSWFDSNHPKITPDVARAMTRRTTLPPSIIRHPFCGSAHVRHSS